MLKKILIVVGLLIVAAVIALAAMVGPRNLIGFIMYGGQRREGKLQVGDPAPAVSLVGLDGASRRDLGRLFGPRPVVLILGSFT